MWRDTICRESKRLSRAVLMAIVLAAGGRAAVSQELNTTVVISRDTLPYRDAVRGLDAVFKGAGRTLRPLTLDETGNLAQIPGLNKRMTPGVIALGERALDYVKKNAAAKPSIVCLALDSAGRPGVTLAHSALTRLELLRQLLPRRMTIGALYIDDAAGRQDVASLESAAQSLGRPFVAYPIDLEYSLDAQLERLSNKFDVLIGTYDLRIFSSSHAQSILLFSYKHRIPLFGLSDAWTRAGAIASVDWDFEDIGRQCGEIALKELRAPASNKAASPPRRVVYSLNVRAERYFKIEFDEILLSRARKKFE